jgi:hypothetical protein
MLIIALVLAVIGLAALVFAVVTSNELVAWVCIGASVLGVVLLIIDALRERQRREARTATREPSTGDGDDSHGGAEHPAAEELDEADESSEPTADSESAVEDAESVSDEHNTR